MVMWPTATPSVTETVASPSSIPASVPCQTYCPERTTSSRSVTATNTASGNGATRIRWLASLAASSPVRTVMLRERIGAASGASATRAFPASAKSAGASCSCAEPDSVASKLAAMESSSRRVVVSVFSICPQGVALCVRSATNSTMLHVQKGRRPATAVLSFDGQTRYPHQPECLPIGAVQAPLYTVKSGSRLSNSGCTSSHPMDDNGDVRLPSPSKSR